MPFVDAITIDLQRLTGLGAIVAGASAPYAVGRIGERVFGRSSPISGAELDLSKETVAWRLEIAGDKPVAIAIDIYDERGDGGPKKLGGLSRSIGSSDLDKCLEIGTDFKLLCDVSARRLDRASPVAVVPRTAVGTKSRATLRAPDSALVELTGIAGLYAPSATGKPGQVRAEAKPGYISGDNAGRVYLNTDLGLQWTKDVQQIELTAEVSIKAGRLPKDAKLKWSVLDIDDPTNDDPGFHIQWGRYVDASDYDAKGAHRGARAADNEGKPAKNPRWEEVGTFKLSGATAQQCTTEIVGTESKVVFHCPDVAGDNFIIAVEIDTKEKLDRRGHQTGIITMWHRIQVDNIRMSSGIPLPMDRVPVFFEPCCVQLDCAPETVVADRQFMAPKDDILSDESAKYVGTVFKPRPGWFCVISALEPHPLPSIKGKTLFTGKAKLQQGGSGANVAEYIEVAGAHPDADFADLTFAGGTVGFKVFSADVTTVAGNTITRCWLSPHDAQPDFTAGDGSLKHAYKVTYNYSPRLTIHAGKAKAGGYGMPVDVDVKVMSPGAFYTAGISPSVDAGGQAYFAGRTVMFTHHGAYYDAAKNQPKPDAAERLLGTIVHELVHAFGMPHKCGYFDFRTPRAKTCCMNYRPNWMVDDARQLITGTNGRTGNDVCGRHLKEVRRVHLEDNKGLKWK
jgi:hypothetical protein